MGEGGWVGAAAWTMLRRKKVQHATSMAGGRPGRSAGLGGWRQGAGRVSGEGKANMQRKHSVQSERAAARGGVAPACQACSRQVASPLAGQDPGRAASGRCAP